MLVLVVLYLFLPSISHKIGIHKASFVIGRTLTIRLFILCSHFLQLKITDFRMIFANLFVFIFHSLEAMIILQDTEFSPAFSSE